MTSMRDLFLPGLLALALCGCGSAEQARLDRGVEFARGRLEAVNHGAVAAMSFGSIDEQGGSVLTFLTASLPAGADLPRFEMDAATQPWTVVVKRGPGPDDFTIEGYGTDLAKPLRTAKVTLRRGGARGAP